MEQCLSRTMLTVLFFFRNFNANKPDLHRPYQRLG